VLNDK